MASQCEIYADSKYECHNHSVKNSRIDLVVYANVLCSIFKIIFECVYDNSVWIISAVIFSFLVYVLYKSYWSPVLLKRELTEVGFKHIPRGPDRDRLITRAQTARRLGNKVPPPYPNGWFAVAESRELKVGGVQAVDALGQNLCVYRGEDGIARVVDAYCPHLGANLGVGGAVSGDCIECPFHKWRFGADGACVSVPGSEHAPKGVSIKHWRTVEVDGAVWIWHDAEQREPLWDISDAPELNTFGYRGRNEYTVSAHIQEIPENGADVAHLNAVHSPSLLTSLGEKFPFLYDLIGRHMWSANWTRGEDHCAHIYLTHDYKILKYNLFHIDVHITQIGPGHVRLLLHSPAGAVLISQSVTPLGANLQRVVHRVFSPVYNAPVAAVLVYSEAAMFERDIAIWNSKRFVSAPTYVRADKTIRAFRSWFSQFYSDHSVSFRDAMQNTLEW
ncbi:cholesterol 7-desaturase nvd [Anticarsia gemmatalis]|uniref:cholesterol 7-desaturase nvd n=1 Tax=Anticarsia gemmatalis TaxID=129554 RepID=UPI003F76632C